MMEGKPRQGEALFVEGKIEEAEECFFNLLEDDPKNAGILSSLVMGDVGTPVKYDGSFNRAGFVTMLLINPTIFYPRHTSEVIGR